VICSLLTEFRQVRSCWRCRASTETLATMTQPSGQTTQLGRFVAKSFEVVGRAVTNGNKCYVGCYKILKISFPFKKLFSEVFGCVREKNPNHPSLASLT